MRGNCYTTVTPPPRYTTPSSFTPTRQTAGSRRNRIQSSFPTPLEGGRGAETLGTPSRVKFASSGRGVVQGYVAKKVPRMNFWAADAQAVTEYVHANEF